jgi:two-component system sensor histidine kinase SenX3
MLVREMRAAAGRALVLVGLLCVAAAVPVAISPTFGWIVTVPIAAVAAAVAAWTIRSVAAPFSDLATSVHDEPRALDPGELARSLASEHRALLATIEGLRSGDHRQKAALAHASDGAILLDPTGHVEYANPVARWLVHDRVIDVARRIGQPELEGLVARALRGSQPTTAEITLLAPEPRHVVARAIPLGDGGCVLLFQDRTDADRLDRVRRDFVANVSHELKTPVAGIRALADVAQSALVDGDGEMAMRFVERLQAEADRLSRLVLDLLDLSRVEAGHALDRQPVEVRALLEGAADRARPVADAKGVSIHIEGSATNVVGDPAQLGMAVRNLVDNAVRYSDEGTVRLSVAADDDVAEISVSDEGIGIPHDELPRIFERFYRVDRARSRATGGTGLGLAIVRHVAENHGGRVEVQSEFGLGSTFTLVLPRAGSERAGNAA